MTTEAGRVKEAVGVFKDIDALNTAVEELERTAFSRDKISMLGNRDEIKKTFGQSEIKPELVEDNPEAPRRSPIHPEEKAIGAGIVIGGAAYIGAVGALLAGGAAVSVPAVLTAAVIGGGGGGVIASILGHNFDLNIKKQIEMGGTVLWVQTLGPKREKIACDILKKNGATHIHIHEIA
ncbi:MAG: hypothetical protein COA45_09410 [Zetaproteobacteria bacterium]|nr:MAG: hypothetical protein COA45_09410 [Zetaproteobacteria bacterium]